MILTDALVATLEANGAMSACALARDVGRRKADVLRALHEDPRFTSLGKGRSCRWDVPPSFDADEAASLWGCDGAMAAEIIFGAGGFLELGFVASLNGNGLVYVTERGLEKSLALCSAGEA